MAFPATIFSAVIRLAFHSIVLSKNSEFVFTACPPADSAAGLICAEPRPGRVDWTSGTATRVVVAVTGKMRGRKAPTSEPEGRPWAVLADQTSHCLSPLAVLPAASLVLHMSCCCSPHGHQAEAQ